MAETDSEQYERKNEALKLRLEHLKEHGDDRLSSRNQVIAEIETAWEHGVFERAPEYLAPDSPADMIQDHIKRLLEDPPWTEEMMQGFMVRTRSDALSTKLNTIDMVDRIREMERKVDRLSMVAYWSLGILIGIAFTQYRWLW